MRLAGTQQVFSKVIQQVLPQVIQQVLSQVIQQVLSQVIIVGTRPGLVPTIITVVNTIIPRLEYHVNS